MGWGGWDGWEGWEGYGRIGGERVGGEGSCRFLNLLCWGGEGKKKLESMYCFVFFKRKLNYSFFYFRDNFGIKNVLK